MLAASARRTTRNTLAALLAASVMVAAACSSATGPIDAFAPNGWPAAHSDARNSGTSPIEGARELSEAWSRSTGGTISSPVSIAANGQLFVGVNTQSGCNLFSFDIDSGRKRWCNRLAPAVTTVTPTVDSATNVYVGEDGGINSFNEHGQLRWRTPVYGTPRSAQFLGDGSVLAVTQLGQVNVLDSQTGAQAVPIHDLIRPPAFLDSPDTDFMTPAAGLDKCGVGAPECPVGAAPAVDLGTNAAYLVLWRPGAIAPQLVSLQYTPGATPGITERWSSDLLPAAVTSSPVLSADGTTVYLTDVDGRLSAYDTANGAAKWAVGAGFGTSASPTVSGDGLIVTAGGNGPIRAFRDSGDSGEQVWARDDLEQAGLPVQAAGGVGYTVVHGEGDILTLLTFDTETGETISQNPLDGASGFSTGTSIGPDGQVVVASYLGEVFTYTR